MTSERSPTMRDALPSTQWIVYTTTRIGGTHWHRLPSRAEQRRFARLSGGHCYDLHRTSFAPVGGYQIARVISAVRAFPGRTSRELCERTGIDRYTLARRLPEAVQAGAISRGEQRTCTITGRVALTWRPAA